MVDVLSRSRSSSAAVTLVGTLAGLVVIGLYFGAGLLVGGWSLSEFLTHLSIETVGYLLTMIVLSIVFVGLPIATYLRFDLITPLVILVLVICAWLTLGAVRGILSPQTIFGLSLDAMYYSPVAVVLYAIVGGGEYFFRDETGD